MSSRWDHYARHLTGEELNGLLRLGHPMPSRAGTTSDGVAQRLPGMSWNELIAVTRAAGILGAGQPPSCVPGVRAIHFDGPTRFAVAWEHGATTTSPGPPRSGYPASTPVSLAGADRE